MPNTINPENIARILFLQKELKDIFAINNSRLGHDLPRSVNSRAILPFGEDFIFMKLRIGEVSRK